MGTQAYRGLYNTSQTTAICESRPDLIIYVLMLQPIPEEGLYNTSQATDMFKSRSGLIIYVFSCSIFQKKASITPVRLLICVNLGQAL